MRWACQAIHLPQLSTVERPTTVTKPDQAEMQTGRGAGGTATIRAVRRPLPYVPCVLLDGCKPQEKD